MIKLYCTYADSLEERLKNVLKAYIPADFTILRTPLGKPYIEGNPVYFSLTHSGNRALIALSDKPVGVDLEIYRGRDRGSVVSRWSESEKAEISGEKDFLKHWTAREAYIKLYGYSLAKMLKRVEFCGGKLLYDGKPQELFLRHYDLGYGMAAVCTEN